MAKFKSVYFSEINPSMWFETREEAEQYDKAAEVATWIEEDPGECISTRQIVARIMDRYDLQERWDYKAKIAEAAEAKDDQDETATA